MLKDMIIKPFASKLKAYMTTTQPFVFLPNGYRRPVFLSSKQQPTTYYLSPDTEAFCLSAKRIQMSCLFVFKLFYPSV